MIDPESRVLSPEEYASAECHYLGQGVYKDLIAGQKGMELVTAIYDATEGFPSREQFGLVSQLRRAAVSVPSNSAEGKAHSSNRDFVRFLRRPRGALAEIETQVLMAQPRKYLDAETATKLTQKIDELGRILSGLINSLKNTEPVRESRLGTQD